MIVCAWNINSIRLRLDMMLDLIKNENIDALLLQETKCNDENFPIAFFEENNLNVIFNGQKSYNGVCIVSKYKIEKIDHNLSQKTGSPYKDARYVQGVVNFNGNEVRLASVYVPNGDENVPDITQSPRFNFKLDFLEELNKEFTASQNEYFICSGDYNVAKTSLDIFSYKSAYGNVGCHPLEHAKMDKLDNNFTDAFRHIDKTSNGYTWYDYRHGRWQQKQGWRIDYHYVSKKLQDKITSCRPVDNIRGLDKSSDHVPLLLELNI